MGKQMTNSDIDTDRANDKPFHMLTQFTNMNTFARLPTHYI